MNQVQQLEKQLDNVKNLVSKRDLAIKLYENADFRNLILEDFCVRECARYAQESADPSLKPEQRADALAMAQAAGHLRRFLSITVTMGNHAESTVDEIREAIDAARNEQVE